VVSFRPRLMWEARLSLKALRSFPSRRSLSRLRSICMNRSHAMRSIIVYSPACVEGGFSEVAPCPNFAMLGTNAPVGSVGKGEMITMAKDATEFSPMGALDIAGLQDGFRGELLSPQDPGYEDARRVWNGSITRFPALIARCAGVADVIAAVKFAKDNGLLVAVRGGGHSFPGLSVCDGGLVIGLSPICIRSASITAEAT
jgi:FAD binding domain